MPTIKICPALELLQHYSEEDPDPEFFATNLNLFFITFSAAVVIFPLNILAFW